MTEHEANAHARLAPSAAGRWARCTASVSSLESIEPEERDDNTEYAQEGTNAHYLGSCALEQDRPPLDFVGEELTDNWGNTFTVDEEMAEAVTVYFDHVRGTQVIYGADAELYVERRLHPGAAFDRDDFWGTGDAVVVLDFVEMEVIDYKHGEGIEVPVLDNYQLLAYGIGALEEHPFVERVTLTIVQPRCGREAVRQWEMSASELYERAYEVFARPLREIQTGRTKYRPSYSACQFCGFRGQCTALAEHVASTIDSLFGDLDDDPLLEEHIVSTRPERLTLEQLAHCLDATNLIHKWIAAIWGRAIHEAQTGREIPGYKLVRRKKNRVFRNNLSVDQVAEALTAAYGSPIEDDLYTEPALRSVAQIEKALKQKARKTFKQNAESFNTLWHRPEGELTVAPQDDPRPAVAAGEMFDDIEEDILR